MSEITSLDKSTGQKRAYALDALRGIAILMMVLSSMEPFGLKNHLPSFMYHTQVPPPDFHYDEIKSPAGVTWVDMVFPFFLFSMGAAIPFAMKRRIEQGAKWYKLLGSILLRGLILSLFAIYVEHIRVGNINPAFKHGILDGRLNIFLIGTGGFLLLFPMLMRLPDSWKPSVHIIIKTAGWIAAAALMFYITYDPNIEIGKGFSAFLEKNDCIIMILANCVVYGTIVYLLTIRNHILRVGILGFICALLLSAWAKGWVQTFHTNFPIPCVDKLSFTRPIITPILKTINSFFTLLTTQFLYVCIPGTIAGDLILRWMETPDNESSEKPAWNNRLYITLAVILSVSVVLSLTLLKGRHTWILVLCMIPIFASISYLLRNPRKSIEYLINGLTKLGMYLLALGLIFEPYEGGIKKDPPTHSYYFISAGLATLMLVVLTIIIDVFKKRKWLQLIIDNGQNPMVAYTAGGNLIGTMAILLGLDTLTSKYLTTPWMYFFFDSVIMTLLTALAVSFCTRKKWFWRT